MVVVLVVVLLAAALIIAALLSDQAIARRAETSVAQRLVTPLGGPVTVHVHGTRFLTQAVRGHFSVVDVLGTGLQLGALRGVDLHAELHHAVLPPLRVLRRQPFEVRCERLTADVRIPYPELARITRLPALVFGFERDRLIASASLPIPGFAQVARISGDAVLSVRAGGSVWLRVRGVSVAGVSVPGIVLNQLAPALTVPIALPQLPYGLAVDSLTPTPAGLLVRCSSRDVTLR